MAKKTTGQETPVNEPTKVVEPEARVGPDERDDFSKMMQDYGVGEKQASVIAQYIADTGTDQVFDKPMELLQKVAMFPKWIHPTSRRHILDHWFALRKIPIPDEYSAVADKPSEEIRKKAAGHEIEEAKFSVDPETGYVRVATTSDKTALTWDEAQKLSKDVLAKAEGVEKKQAEKAKKEATYVYDTEQGQVRMAKGDEVGGTLDQAKELKKMAEGGKKETAESPFITDAEGNWGLNPKARVTGIELMALDTMRRSQAKGEPLDPLEAMAQTAERLKVYQEVLGGGKSTPEWMTDPLKFIETIRTITGEGKGDDSLKQEISGLKDAIRLMQEAQYKAQIDSQRSEITALGQKIESLTGRIDELKRPVTGMTEIDLLNQLGTKALDELGGLRKDVKDTAREAITGGRLPPRKTTEERGEQHHRMRQTLEDIEDIEQLGQEIFGK